MSDEMAMVMDLLWAAAHNDEATVEERRVEMDLLAGAMAAFLAGHLG